MSPEQRRFSDKDAAGFLRRHESLALALIPADSVPVPELVTLGTAIHSVRAVSETQMKVFAQVEGPLHIHLSEQPAENESCVRAYGRTPTGLLESLGLLGPHLSAVHATHLSPEDISALGTTGSSIVMCPTTEADLADGIGPARELADAGATIALGSDQHVILDALRENQSLEAGERLRSLERGRFSPAELIACLTQGGARSLDLPVGELAVGTQADFILLDTYSPRTLGANGEQLVLAGSAADIALVVTAGQDRMWDGVHVSEGDIGQLYAQAFAAIGLD